MWHQFSTRPAHIPLIRRRALLLIGASASLIGGFVLIATAFGWGHADVRGVRLEGGLELFFLGGLAVSVTMVAAATVGLLRRRRWSVVLLAAAWPTFAAVCLVLDRVTPAPGAGRPLIFYVALIGLLPMVFTLLAGTGNSRAAGG